MNLLLDSMPSDAVSLARRIFEDAISAHRAFAADRLDAVIAAAEAMRAALAQGRLVLAFGNGGSAADAQHLVAELVGRFERERRGLRAIALTADSNVMTALANDYGYEQMFARQIEALGSPGDVAVGLSTSGRSPNVVAALAAARARGLTAVAITGRDGGPCGAAADIHVCVPVESTARIQEVHRTVLHAICALIDRGLTV
jgi:D-sedoheptulose 7-phosphate isomerase